MEFPTMNMSGKYFRRSCRMSILITCRTGSCLKRSIIYGLTEALRTGAGHIGYSIRSDLRGRGYGTAGLKLTLDKAREIIPEDEVFFRVRKDNIASQRVLEKNGAYVTGEDDEHLFMRIRKQ